VGVGVGADEGRTVMVFFSVTRLTLDARASESWFSCWFSCLPNKWFPALGTACTATCEGMLLGAHVRAGMRVRMCMHVQVWDGSLLADRWESFESFCTGSLYT
jgi:hypothetical protein